MTCDAWKSGCGMHLQTPEMLSAGSRRLADALSASAAYEAGGMWRDGLDWKVNHRGSKNFSIFLSARGPLVRLILIRGVFSGVSTSSAPASWTSRVSAGVPVSSWSRRGWREWASEIQSCLLSPPQQVRQRCHALDASYVLTMRYVCLIIRELDTDRQVSSPSRILGTTMH
jgi:hypothetical protein